MKRSPEPARSFRRRAVEGVCEIDCFDPTTVSVARSALPSENALDEAAECFQVLAHPGRLRILKALQGRELCVCDIAQLLGASMSGTSQQLRELRRLGYYTVADPFWVRLAETVLARVGASRPAARPRRKPIPA
jgi:hypothetical protein